MLARVRFEAGPADKTHQNKVRKWQCLGKAKSGYLLSLGTKSALPGW